MLCFVCFGFGEDEHEEEGQECIEDEALVRELIASEPCGRVGIENPSDDRSEYSSQRQEAVAHLKTSEHAKAEHTKQWSVGIGRHFIDSLYD